MRPYAFTIARSMGAATGHTGSDTMFLAGGTTLVDLMKLEVLAPARVVDINGLPMTGITIGRRIAHRGVGADDRRRRASRRTPRLHNDR